MSLANDKNFWQFSEWLWLLHQNQENDSFLSTVKSVDACKSIFASASTDLNSSQTARSVVLKVLLNTFFSGIAECFLNSTFMNYCWNPDGEEICVMVLDTLQRQSPQVHPFVDSIETQAVRNNKKDHIIILEQTIVSILELFNLLRIEDMNPSIKRCQSSIFPLRSTEIVFILRGRFQTNQNRIK